MNKALPHGTHGVHTRMNIQEWSPDLPNHFQGSGWAICNSCRGCNVVKMSRKEQYNTRCKMYVYLSEICSEVNHFSFFELWEISVCLVSTSLPVLSSWVQWRALYKQMQPQKGPPWQVPLWCHLVPWGQRQTGDLWNLDRQTLEKIIKCRNNCAAPWQQSIAGSGVIGLKGTGCWACWSWQTRWYCRENREAGLQKREIT